MPEIARYVRVTGRVQGVFFRAWTRGEAQAVGVRGWVRNRSDGSVEAHLEGEADAVEGLIDRIRQGPPGARVSEVEVEAAAAQELSSFEVLRA
ncbi:MAG TPA: acylphosphatase [Sphingomicrobium sp.]